MVTVWSRGLKHMTVDLEFTGSIPTSYHWQKRKGTFSTWHPTQGPVKLGEGRPGWLRVG